MESRIAEKSADRPKRHDRFSQRDTIDAPRRGY
jgi:hypothetical protein